jgi:hypothetical protein
MEGWDDYTAPTCDGKPEKRPNFFITSDDWVKRTRRRNTIYALVYGQEHLPSRELALRQFEDMHEKHPNIFRLEWLYAAWE